MSTSRRRFLAASAAAAAAAAAGAGAAGAAAGAARATGPTSGGHRAGVAGALGGLLPVGRPWFDYRPVETPNGATLPWKEVDGVKVFHLIAEPVTHEFAPGLVGECWGYNGRVHGPTIEAVEGDRVRIYVTNRLDTATTVHWHGMHLPNGMDGVGGLTQRAIEPGSTFRYEFTLRQHGTLMYHSHHDEMTQMAMGMMGMFIVHPRTPPGPLPDRDFVYMLSEWAIEPGTRRPDPNVMTDFNVITLNARVFPGTAPMVVKTGERVRIRLGNLSAMDHHPMHLHGHSFLVTETDGGVIPEGGRWPQTTVLVPVGSTRTIEFVADEPGDWAFHCHMTHHVMTQMGHDVPNLIGVVPGIFDTKLAEAVPDYMTMGEPPMPHAPGEDRGAGREVDDPTIPRNSLPMVGGIGGHGYVTMGGMFSVLKVRDEITDYGDPGWYRNPPGTVADVASAEELSRDGIRP